MAIDAGCGNLKADSIALHHRRQKKNTVAGLNRKELMNILKKALFGIVGLMLVSGNLYSQSFEETVQKAVSAAASDASQREFLDRHVPFKRTIDILRLDSPYIFTTEAAARKKMEETAGRLNKAGLQVLSKRVSGGGTAYKLFVTAPSESGTSLTLVASCDSEEVAKSFKHDFAAQNGLYDSAIIPVPNKWGYSLEYMGDGRKIQEHDFRFNNYTEAVAGWEGVVAAINTKGSVVRVDLPDQPQFMIDIPSTYFRFDYKTESDAIITTTEYALIKKGLEPILKHYGATIELTPHNNVNVAFLDRRTHF